VTELASIADAKTRCRMLQASKEKTKMKNVIARIDRESRVKTVYHATSVARLMLSEAAGLLYAASLLRPWQGAS
jgi:hypothetical protein